MSDRRDRRFTMDIRSYINTPPPAICDYECAGLRSPSRDRNTASTGSGRLG
jgi:hypothetical protein